MSSAAALRRCVIIGAGPAGLTAALELSRRNFPAIVLEADNQVGGIARTVEYKGCRFDIGGHRFYSKVQAVEDWWKRILGDDLLTRPRLSRIYYAGRFFDYPLKPMNALLGLGPIEAVRIGLSYIASRLFPHPEEKNLEQWVTNRFGRRLYEIFFKTYTEKVWGMACAEIGADWASQRIKDLDLLTALRAAFLGNRRGGKVVTSLIEEFRYPRFGPGMMWERVCEMLGAKGYGVELGRRVTRISHRDGRITSVTVSDSADQMSEVGGTEFISTMPICELFEALDPPPPAAVLQAACELRHRDFMTVGLILSCPDPFPDNWIYIHSPDVGVGRVQNFKAWSPEMVADSSQSCLGFEYFLHQGDALWSTSDADLIAMATRECAQLGLAREEDVVDGVVIRMPKAYPVYDLGYEERLTVIREYLEQIPNLHLVGRNGQHRYNNQDHSMVTAMYAARNIDGEDLDVWSVNVEEDYLEEAQNEDRSGASGDRLVPQRNETGRAIEALRSAFALYDPLALGVAVAIPAAFGLFVVTALLLLQGGDPVGPKLSLLDNYLFYYRVSWGGAFVGLAEVGAGGFAFGWVLAKAINAVVGRHRKTLVERLERMSALASPETDLP